MTDHQQNAQGATWDGTEAQYQAVLEDLTETICRFRADGTLTFVNDAYCRLVGRSREQLLGSRWQPQAVEDDVPMIESELSTLSPANPVVVIENRLHVAGGGIRWIQFVNRAFNDADGRLTELQSVGRDITEHKRTEHRLRDSEALLQQILDSNPDPVFAIDPEYRLIAYNRTLRQGLEAVGAPALTVGEVMLSPGYTEDERCRWRTAYDRALKGESFALEMNAKHHYPRSVRFFEHSFAPLRDATGSVAGALIVAHDVTERADRERENEKIFKTFVENSQDGIDLLDLRTGRYEVRNQALAEITGFTLEELARMVSQDPYDRVHPADHHILREHREALLANDRQLPPVEYRWKVKSGEYRWFSHTWTLVRDEEGNPAAVMGASRDITERKRTEQLIRDFAAELLAAREQERKRFSEALHHDVGSLAVGMAARLELADTSIRDGDSERALVWIERAREMLDEAVSNLREIAIALRPPELDALGLSAALRQHVARINAQEGTRVRLVDGLGSERLLGDAVAALFRIAQEALTNAIRHGRADNVDVELMQQDCHIALTVRDDGSGFDTAILDREGAPRIGLRSMGETAILVGGDWEVQSSPGAGTIVRARVPWPQPETAPAVTREEEAR